MRALKLLLAPVLALLLPAMVLAQSGAVEQAGPVVSFHSAAWYGNGQLADAGTPLLPNVSAFGLFSGANCPFGISSQTGPGSSSAAGGLLQICQTATSTTFMVTGTNGQATPSVFFNIGGTLYPFPGSGGGNVNGPGSTTSGDIACWNNTGGTLLKDCGGLGTFAGQNYATPPAIGGSIPAAGSFTALSASTSVTLPFLAAGTLVCTNGSSQLTTSSCPFSSAVASFNGRTGAVSLLSADVTGALAFTPLSPANNLSELASASTARTNLGLGTFATQNYATPPVIGGTTPNAVDSTTDTTNNLSLNASQSALGNGLYNSTAGNEVDVSVNGAKAASVTSTGINNTAVGATTAAAVTGTTVSASTSLGLGTGAGTMLCSATAPTVTSAGTSPSIPDNNGTCSFSVNVGTGGTATTVVLGLPTAAHGWSCEAADITTQSTSVFLQKQTASSTTSASIINYNTAGSATAFASADVLRVSCRAD